MASSGNQFRIWAARAMSAVAIPANTVAPVVSGSTPQGSTLTSTTGTWTGSPTYTYQWKRDGVNIGSATSSTYATVLADVGTSVTCAVTGTNVSGNASATSNGITVTAASSSFTVTGNGYGDTFNSAYAPIGYDRLLARSLNPTKVESAVYLQEECCLPHSPAATSFSVAGTDVSRFEAGSAAGTIELTAAARTALTPGQTLSLTITPINANGSGAPFTLSYYIPTVANQFFVSYGSGTNSGVRGAWNDPYQFMPGTADYLGTARAAFTAGQVVFYKGEIHRTAIVANKTFSTGFSSRMTHAGSTGNPFIIELGGWGGRAQILGDDVITGGTTPTQAQVNGNTNNASLKRYDLTSVGALEPFQGVYDGDALTANSKLYRAQFPTPATLAQNRLPDLFQPQGSERYGMRMVPVATSGTSFMCTNGGLNSDGYPAASGTLVTLKDPAIAARYGSVSAAALGKFMFLLFGNSLAEMYADTYDFATSTVTFNSGIALAAKDGLTFGRGAYAILFNPLDIVQPGQYALSQDGQTMDMWPPNNSTISISRRYSGVDYCMGGYVYYSGGCVARFCCGTNRAGTTRNGGTAFHAYLGASDYKYECDIIGAWIRQCYADDSGVIYGQASAGNNTSAIRNSIIGYNLVTECEANFIRFSTCFEGPLSTPTLAQLQAQTRGLVIGNSAPDLGINQTFVLFLGGTGFRITKNNNRGNVHLHGNVFAMYNFGTQTIQYFLIDRNDIVNSMRGFTTDDANTVDRHGYYYDNFVLLADGRPFGENAGFNMFGGEKGGTVRYNLAMNYSNTGYWQAATFPGTGPMTITNNVFGGLTVSNGWLGSITDNYFTNQVQSTDYLPSGGTYTGNVQLTSVSSPVAITHYTSLTAGMIAKLDANGPRTLGVFRSYA